MFLFNREEVYIGFSMKDAQIVMDILKENGIQYQYKVINLSQKWTERGIPRNTSGNIGTNRESHIEHIVYVKKENLEEADFLIRTYFKKQ